MQGRTMRYIGLLAALLLLYVFQLSCKETLSFEGTIEPVENPESVAGYLQRLKLATISGGIKEPVIYVSPEYGYSPKYGFPVLSSVMEARHGRLWLENLAEVTTISSGGRRLADKDLRIGHQVRVLYPKDTRPEEARAKVEILNYSPPSKILRITVSIDLAKWLPVSPEKLEDVTSDIIACLSWRLPPDIGIAKPNEIPEGSTLLGDLKVTYKRYGYRSSEWTSSLEGPTIYMVEDFIEIDVKLPDGNVSTNWTQLRLVGGDHIKSVDGRNVKFNQGVLRKVPSFELYQSPSKQDAVQR